MLDENKEEESVTMTTGCLSPETNVEIKWMTIEVNFIII